MTLLTEETVDFYIALLLTILSISLQFLPNAGSLSDFAG